MGTESESEVQAYFEAGGAPVKKISEGAERSPDFHVVVDKTEIIVEVKQFDATEEELKRLNELKDGEVLVVDATPGKGVRKKISDGAAQLSALAKGKCAALLVLYNNRPFLLGNPATPYDVRVGMYGFDTIVLVRSDTAQAPLVSDRKFGGSRKLTEKHNTTISAIAVMERRAEELTVKVYHNEHAAIPIPHGLLKRFGAKEYVLSEREKGRFQEWAEINGG